jgi:hypothetical protein
MITLGRLSTKDSNPTTGDASASPKSRPHHAFVALPVVGTAVLPKLVCPFCWPAYTGLLSSLGLGFINYTPYLLPLTLAFLLVAIVSLRYGAKIRRGYSPLLLGLLAASMIITGKFLFASHWTLYGGLALLLGASLWNAWPPRGRVCPV